MKHNQLAGVLKQHHIVVTDDTLETAERNDTTYCVVGVVHWHPTSIRRVERIIRAVNPSTIGLEVPAELISRHRELNRKDEGEGEMCAAIEAAPDDTDIVGMDAPSAEFKEALAESEIEDKEVVRRVEAERASMLSATRKLRQEKPPQPKNPKYLKKVPDEMSVDEAVENERKMAEEAKSVINLERDKGRKKFDELRERSWVKRLDSIDSAGPVVVVCGMAHLESLAEKLRNGL